MGFGGLPVHAQELRPVPALNEVGITEQLGQSVPMELQFQNHDGEQRSFGSLFESGKPVILTLNYASCPMLCNLQLTGLVNAINQLDELAGQDFNIATVSIDPEEKPSAAADVRFRYLEAYNHKNGDWNFLVGKQEAITALAESIGFGYRFLPDEDEFAHTAALVLLSPDGKISRYLYGIEYDPETLRLSLLETAKGEVRSSIDRLILFCFQYDATKGRYAPAILNITRIAGALTIAVLGAFILRLLRRSGVKTENYSA
jgi:protein SCO1/2